MKIHATDLGAIAKATADLLGAPWTINPDLSSTGIAHLDGPGGRRAGLRARQDGTTLQLWITGAPAPSLSDGVNQAAREANRQHLAEPLGPGANYHTVLNLAELDDAPIAIACTFREDLFPAFDHKPLAVNHRPWLDASEQASSADPQPQQQVPAEPADTADSQMRTAAATLAKAPRAPRRTTKAAAAMPRTAETKATRTREPVAVETPAAKKTAKPRTSRTKSVTTNS
ncbi:hypothetical protein E6W39_29340 [Kitasatospora acidiphila]|uniref:Uncharacterized protein n=1 Tax=Kitasatospora acidiphila TaxID=2567942 RepID=A0A540W990_9ACTN|nr:hypothetical protein [Kitasatospora acidiphila]TQF05589.1 hypothetical protein E6W39_29340 [Kitasatospora acidiphila]